MIHESLWYREQTHADIRTISCMCKIFTCIKFLPFRRATIMEPTVDYSRCERAGCQSQASRTFHRRLDGTGESFWYCSAKHMQEDRKRCERRNRNVRTKVHQQAAASQAMKTVAPVSSNSAASGQPPIPPAAVGNNVAYIAASKCYHCHYYGVNEQKYR